MSPYKRTDILLNQKRSYLTGMIEVTNDQYVIYDEINDEIHLIEDIQDDQMEILSPHGWKPGKWIGLGKVKTELGLFSINSGETVRLKKRLPHALDEMLKELNDETFIQFIKQLNNLSFSLFDCVYSYNQLLFLDQKVHKKGVSFYQFDNEDCICAIQHHFERGVHSSDRFEITTSLCKRSLICTMY
jgi:Protein of unknown function (DUF2777)